MTDRVTSLHVSGMRCIDHLDLPLDGLTVLIGETGVGKSTVVEACELLRRVADANFFEHLHRVHGGPSALTRQESPRLELGLDLDGAGGSLHYRIAIAQAGTVSSITQEDLWAGDHLDAAGPFGAQARLLARGLRTARAWRDATSAGHSKSTTRVVETVRRPASARLLETEVASETVALSSHGSRPPNAGIARMLAALAGIEVHVPFQVLPWWALRSGGMGTTMRAPERLEPAHRLRVLGGNLASAWHALKNDLGEAHWKETIETVRVGLGPDVETVNAKADPAGGHVGLWLKYQGLEQQVPAIALSDGALSYLAIVAATRLATTRSLLVVDEPEAHLHPELQLRVVQLLAMAAEKHPVVIATHSDRVLDALGDSVAERVRVLTLDESRTAQLSLLDGSRLGEWLEDYRGFGALRAEGLGAAVLRDPGPPKS